MGDGLAGIGELVEIVGREAKALVTPRSKFAVTHEAALYEAVVELQRRALALYQAAEISLSYDLTPWEREIVEAALEGRKANPARTA